jgi:hypothetical protein
VNDPLQHPWKRLPIAVEINNVIPFAEFPSYGPGVIRPSIPFVPDIAESGIMHIVHDVPNLDSAAVIDDDGFEMRIYLSGQTP